MQLTMAFLRWLHFATEISRGRHARKSTPQIHQAETRFPQHLARLRPKPEGDPGGRETGGIFGKDRRARSNQVDQREVHLNRLRRRSLDLLGIRRWARKTGEALAEARRLGGVMMSRVV